MIASIPLNLDVRPQRGQQDARQPGARVMPSGVHGALGWKGGRDSWQHCLALHPLLVNVAQRWGGQCHRSVHRYTLSVYRDGRGGGGKSKSDRSCHDGVSLKAGEVKRQTQPPRMCECHIRTRARGPGGQVIDSQPARLPREFSSRMAAAEPIAQSKSWSRPLAYKPPVRVATVSAIALQRRRLPEGKRP